MESRLPAPAATEPAVRIANARLQDGTLADITVHGARIASVSPASGAPSGQDAQGRLILPALIDGHVHLDKTLWGMPWRPNDSGPTVRSRIEAERRLRPTLATPVQARATALLQAMIALGTAALRTHVDIDETVGLAGLHAVLETVERHRDRVEIQVVAFPQSGIVTRPGVADLLDQALRQGATHVGGLDPLAIDGDADAHLDVVFGLATRHGKGIDIHLHDTGPAGNAQLRRIAALSADAGLQGRVTVSHAFSLGTPDADDFARTADALAAGGVSILTSAPGPVPMPPVLPLRARGVTVFAGNDNIRDLWSPHGTGDMLERVWLVAQRQGFRTDADLATAFELATVSAAAAMAIEPRRIEPGAPADFMLLPSGTLAEAIVSRPPDREVWLRGVRRPLP